MKKEVGNKEASNSAEQNTEKSAGACEADAAANSGANIETESGAAEKSAEEECAEAKERYLRLNAEFQNYKKRVEKEKAELIKYGNERLITDMLSVIDNIERAVEGSALTEDKKLREGIVLVKKSLDEVLKANGLEPIEAQDMEFNHDEHYAVMTEEVEGVQEGIVVDVLQKGYKLNGKVIRPSMVKVSK